MHPALILIFTFGIFPVAFAIYVSLHKWRIVRTDFVGMGNYVKAIGNLAYVFGFFLGIGALLAVYLLIQRVIREARELGVRPYALLKLFVAPSKELKAIQVRHKDGILYSMIVKTFNKIAQASDTFFQFNAADYPNVDVIELMN